MNRSAPPSRGMPSLRLGVAILIVGSAVVALLGGLGYWSLVDYCADSPEVAMGGDRLSCLEPPHWFAIQFGLVALVVLELVVVAVAAVAALERRAKPRPDTGGG